MISVAIKMLIGNRAAFIGAIFGIFLAILLISQQSAIFLGLLSRSYRVVTAISSPDIWVIDPDSYGEDQIRTMPKDYLSYVKDIPGIAWAGAVNYAILPATTPSGEFKVAEVYGIDDESMVGSPKLLEGNIGDLRREGGVVIDSSSAATLLSKVLPDGTRVPAKPGDILEINGYRAVIVGIGKMIPGFFPQPILFMTNSQFQKYSGTDKIQFIAAKTQKGANIEDVLRRINSHPNILGLTKDQLEWRMQSHFLKTGILINFALSVGLGLIIGFSIAGQIFYIMTLHNIQYYALIKALGGTKTTILLMILSQVLIVGFIGFILGTGATLLWGYAIKNTSLTFQFPWQLLVFTGSLALSICLFTAFLSIRKVIKIDPQMLMNGS
jgi:putative ABC transport system permease protein